MAKMTERNGFVLSCEPSLNAHKFIFPFFSSANLFCYVFVLYVLFFLLIFQADISLFLFHLIAENLILHIFISQL